MNKQELLNALEKVYPALGTGKQVEQSDFFAFRNGHVVTFNDELCISHPVDLDVEGAVSARELYKLLRKTKAEEVEVTHRRGEMLLEAGKMKAEFYIQDITLPTDEIEQATGWTPLPQEFIRACRFTMQATRRDRLRPVLGCVHLNANGYIEASDSYRIAYVNLQEAFETTLIPASSIKQVVNYNPTEYSFVGGWAHFRNEEGTIVSCRQLADDQFPDTSNYIQAGKEGTEVQFPTATLEILDRAITFVTEDASVPPVVNITINDGELTVHSKSDHGQFNESTEIETEHTVNFMIKPYLLYDILKHERTCIVSNTLLRFEGADWLYVSTLAEWEE